jgi:ribosomal protein S18 acetylase RimI-like enzyme
MRAFAEAGLDAATLSVDTANPTGAVGIYERLGFRPIRRTVRLQRPYPLDGLSLVSNLFANHGQG